MQADMPRENTIGIITSHKITGYSLSANMPENMAEGEVWISIGLSSPVSFSVLRKPTIMVHPCFAKQYISGVMEDVTAKSFQNGKWADWITYYYNKGDECESLTGGWDSYSYRFGSTSANANVASAPSVEKNAASIKLTQGAWEWSNDYNANRIKKGAYFTEKMVDLSSSNTLIINVISEGLYGNAFTFGITTDKKDGFSAVASVDITEAGEFSIDISSVTDPVYLFIAANGTSQETWIEFNCVQRE